MKLEYIKAIYEGEVVKSQEFVTEKGTYDVILVRKGTEVYFYKYLNRNLVECCNLSKIEGRRIEDGTERHDS